MYDYASEGMYFITICTSGMKCILGQIETVQDLPIPVLSEQGAVVEKAILMIPRHYSGISVENYVVMPNHVHLMLDFHAAGGRMVSAPTVVGSLKRYVSRQLGVSIWQKGYYDHVIRNETDYMYHMQYIDENPKKWAMGKDEYYS